MAIRTESGSGHIAPPYTPGYEVVTFVWSNKHGWCYDCGMPAAFFLPRAYINETNNPGAPDQGPTDTNKRCGICAANAAAEGTTVQRIEEEYPDGYWENG